MNTEGGEVRLKQKHMYIILIKENSVEMHKKLNQRVNLETKPRNDTNATNIIIY